MNEGREWAISRLAEHGNTKQPSTAELKDLRNRLEREFEAVELEKATGARRDYQPAWWEKFLEAFNFKTATLAATAAVVIIAMFVSVVVINREAAVYKGVPGIEIELYSSDQVLAPDPSRLSYIDPNSTVLSNQYLQFRLISDAGVDRYLYIGAFDEDGVFTWYFPSPSNPKPLLVPGDDVIYSPVSVDVGRTHQQGIIRIVAVESEDDDLFSELDEIFREYAGKISYNVGNTPPEKLVASATDYRLYSFLLVVKSFE